MGPTWDAVLKSAALRPHDSNLMIMAAAGAGGRR